LMPCMINTAAKTPKIMTVISKLNMVTPFMLV
jgi:hypothetical protein